MNTAIALVHLVLIGAERVSRVATVSMLLSCYEAPVRVGTETLFG